MENVAPSNQTLASLRWSGLSDVGRFRKNNEDAFLAVTFDNRELRYLGKIGEGCFDQGDFVFAVSDGMGGAKSGEFASKIALENITKLLPKSFPLSAQRIDQFYPFNVFLGKTKIQQVLYHPLRSIYQKITSEWWFPNKVIMNGKTFMISFLEDRPCLPEMVLIGN